MGSRLQELIDGGIHKIDVLLYLAGRPRNVYARALPRVLADLEGKDAGVLTLSKNGAVGLVFLRARTK